jgi:F0F1-type ATP synthase membrane subunit b/b'
LLDQASELTKEARKIEKETSDFIENAKIDIAMQEEKAIRSFNENIEKMQEDLNKKNAENSAIALASIDKSIQELSDELGKKVPEMVALACNIMYPDIKGE